MVLDGYWVEAISDEEIESADGGICLLGSRIGIFALIEACIEIGEGWCDAHKKANTTW